MECQAAEGRGVIGGRWPREGGVSGRIFSSNWAGRGGAKTSSVGVRYDSRSIVYVAHPEARLQQPRELGVPERHMLLLVPQRNDDIA